MWEALGCRNLGDYHDLYVETDMLLLADVFRISGLPREIRPGPGALLQRARFELGCTAEKDRPTNQLVTSPT